MREPRRIKDIGYTISELNQTERELVEGIEGLGYDQATVRRVVNIISNKFSYAREVVAGQNWLERNGHITVDRSKT